MRFSILWALLLMAIPTFQAAGTGQAGVGAITLSWPTHQADDIGLLMVETDDEAAVLSGAGASDWTELDASPQSSAGRTRLTVFRARATGSSQSDVTVDDPGNHAVGQILTYRGCITTGSPVDVDAGDFETGNETVFVVPGATTTVADCLVVMIVANEANSDADQFTADDWTNADLSDVVAAGRQHFQSTVGNGGGVYPSDGGKASAGAYGTSTGTFIAGVDQGRISVAFKPPVVTAAYLPLDRAHQPQHQVLMAA